MRVLTIDEENFSARMEKNIKIDRKEHNIKKDGLNSVNNVIKNRIEIGGIYYDWKVIWFGIALFFITIFLLVILFKQS